MANSNQEMYFKHPEILYFLSLLILPIIVHLFQFRRYQKEYFTNVRFLKEIITQTRKSSVIKKWLLLFTRMLVIACLVLAFAQPCFEAQQHQAIGNELVLVLDNSYSMQAEGEQGPLLQRAIQEIIQEIPKEKTVSIITNDQAYWHTTVGAIRNDLLQIECSATPFSLKNTWDKIHHGLPNSTKDVVFLTDGKGIQTKDVTAIPKGVLPHWIFSESTLKSNVSVDSVAVTAADAGFYDLKIKLSSFGEVTESVSLSVYSDQVPIAKSIVAASDINKVIQIKIPNTFRQGFVKLADKGLAYDNTYFFSIPKTQKTKVYAIGETHKNEFLTRIYTSDEFEITTADVSQIAYSALENQDVIVLNEIKDISVSLQSTVLGFYEKGGVVLLIPSEESDITSLNKLLSLAGNIRFESYQKQQRLITQINFQHDLFRTVFEQKVTNFQYPKTAGNFIYKGSASTALSFDNKQPFLISIPKGLGQLYVFTAPINQELSNFKQSPLVVPTFYKMANSKVSNVQSFVVGQPQKMLVDIALAKDEVLRIKDAKNVFIPTQEVGAKKAQITFGAYPTYAGNFEIQHKNKTIDGVSFNTSREESDITQTAISPDGIATDLSEVLIEFSQNRTDNEFWRWLLVLTLVFLMFEILIQKFLK